MYVIFLTEKRKQVLNVPVGDAEKNEIYYFKTIHPKVKKKKIK